ncbi:cytochrome c oxidase subunit II [Sphingosinicella sp. CPCC 101087]|uniref:cytochrome c oxidase subunit II n=1 Tax=Sphingosinicella sp. CPCC 101087 TaxID=2497754 RepID=UPI00101D1549|nr:cytochrome c oxidase subunit II [Sphingosinicella sp. CPCC 101087]
MRTLFKLFAIAAALGLAPAAALGQAAAPTQAPPALQPAATPTDSISAQSQAQPAQPEQSSDPALAPTISTEEPSDAQVAESVTFASSARSEIGVGQPDGRAALQDQFTPIGEEAAWFHNVILMPAITAITLLVLVLLAWVIIRYRRAANPTPSRTTHNTLLEVAWTLVPVLILVVIAVPSIRLLAHQYSPPQADITVKAIGNQWYWEYEYPDLGVQLVSNMLEDEQAQARGEPRQLAVDERMVVPAGATVKVIVTSNDVIHAWGVPAFWTKIDAVPGRLNETWFKTDRPGIYYGVCYELCGVRHGYMPIAVEVVPPEQFAAWVASKGGTMPGAAPAQPAAAAQPAVAAGEATEATPAPSNTVEAPAQQAPVLSRESTQTE